jgi:hypothetical protein
MNAPCPPSPPFPPNQNWQWNGSRWVCTASTGTVVITKVLNASAPYTPSPGLQSLVVETVGGGGGGGSAGGLTSTMGGAGGGGAGGYSRKTLAAPMVAGGVAVTIGPGGAGNYAGGADGASFPGGVTSFGALCVANGGGGGQSNDSAQFWGEAGAGGAAGAGDVAAVGSPGGPGTSAAPDPDLHINVWGGFGGNSFFGGGGVSALCPAGTTIPGSPGLSPGAGGSGGVYNQSTANQPGGQGANGVCIVTEYCWADAGDIGCGCAPTSGGARVAIGWQGHDGFDND